MDKVLSSVIDEYWADFVRHKNDDFVVKPSIPIIWFGDIDNYMKSKLKVVTVAINPSDVEFIEPRFMNVEKLYEQQIITYSDKNELYNSLNNYYMDNPYMKWFGNFEKVLSCINSSYNNLYRNIAVHLDIKTAIATSTKWGDLTPLQKNTISNTELFKALLAYLRPDVILYSSDALTLKKEFGLSVKENVDLHFIDKPNLPTFISSYSMVLNDKPTLLISGRNYKGTPFGGFTPGFVTEKMSIIRNHKNYKEIFKNV